MSLRRLACLATLCSATLSVAAHAAPEGSNWQHVQALPAGTTVQVKVASRSTSCALKEVDADSLTCLRGKDIRFQRTEIQLIRISRRSRSVLIGTAIGGGVGAAVGEGIGRSWGARKSKSIPVGMALLTPVGLVIGASTDFARETVYRAH